MINTVYLSSSHISFLARLAGVRPFPWSPLLEHLGVSEVTDEDIQKLADRGLIVDDGAGPRGNSAFEIALRALAEPEELVQISVPDIPAVSICRSGQMVVGWHPFAHQQAALSFPLTVEGRHRLLTDLFGADDVEDLTAGTRRELTRAELDSWPFDPPLTYGLAVRRVTFIDPAEPPVVDALHVFRSGTRLIVTRALGPGQDDKVEVQDLNLRQLTDLVFTLTVPSDALQTGPA